MKEKTENFLFSVVIPVYNAEKYLDETIKSIIGQSIGFCEHIELILVNNGTKDSCEDICLTYQMKYPKNVKYIKLEENIGPSGARNLGAQHATGKYINYFDSDDKWGKTAFAEAHAMFQRYPELNVMACREKRFDAYDAWHIFDYIFERDLEIIDIFENPDCVWFAAHSLFFRRCAIKRFYFDESLSDSEDMKLVNQILLNEKRYGLVKKAVYYYRERSDGTSLVQNYTKKRYWYFEVLPNVTGSLLALSKQLYGECIPYLRWLIMFNLQGRTRADLPSFFSREDCSRYRQIITDLLQYIDDDIILQQRLLTQEQKINVLRLKYGNRFCNQLSFQDGTFYYQDKRILHTRDEGCLSLELLEIKGGYLELLARLSLPELSHPFSFYAADDQGNRYDYTVFELDRSFLDQRVASGVAQRHGLRFHLPLTQQMHLSFVLSVNGVGYPLNFRYGKYFPLTRALHHSHLQLSGWLIRADETGLLFSRCGFWGKTAKQFSLWWELLRKKKKTSLLCHIYCYLLSFFPKRKELWLFADRMHYAGDNGELMFHYVNQQKNPKVKTCFVIDETSPDFSRLQQLGRVISNRGKKYKLLFLRADKIIASHFDSANVYPLERHREYLKDLLRNKFIYLQHGVIKDDLSSHDSKLRTGVSGFVVSGLPEYESMINSPYGYLPQELWVTGLARHDTIYNCDPAKAHKLVLIAPTWRNNLKDLHWSSQDGLILYTPEFKRTEFFRFYNALLQDERLLSVMRHKGYKGHFRLHPVLKHFAGEFTTNDVFSVEEESPGYREEIESVSLLITDYSSTAFDYAYALKPCIYAQFDAVTFYQGHTYVPGYFNYQSDGFGPVCFDYESTVQTIIATIEGGCVLEDKYRVRVESFFAYRDGKNRERIYREILKTEER